MRSACYVTLFTMLHDLRLTALHFNENVLTLNFHRKLFLRGIGVVAIHAGSDIKLPPVPRAGDDRTFDFAFAQRPSLVRADLIHRMKRPVEIKDRNPLVTNFHTSSLANGNVTCLGHFDKITHEADPPQSE